MSPIATCPTCQGLVSRPAGARGTSIVRCPLCHAQYKLESACEHVVPALEVLAEDLHVFEPTSEPTEGMPLGETLPTASEHASAITADELGLNLELAPDEDSAGAVQFGAEGIRFEPSELAEMEAIEFETTEEPIAAESADESDNDEYVTLVPPEPLAEVEQDEPTIAFTPDDSIDEELQFPPSESDPLEREFARAESGDNLDLHPRDAESDEEIAAEVSDFSFEPPHVPFVPVPEDDEDEIHLAGDDDEGEQSPLEFQAASNQSDAHPLSDIAFKRESYKKPSEPSMLGNLVGVVGGGVIGIAIAYVLLLRFGGPERDVFGLGAKLPAWLVGSGFDETGGDVALMDAPSTLPVNRDKDIAQKLNSKDSAFAPLPRSAATDESQTATGSPSTQPEPTAKYEPRPKGPIASPDNPFANDEPLRADEEPFAAAAPAEKSQTSPAPEQTPAVEPSAAAPTASIEDPIGPPDQGKLEAELSTSVPAAQLPTTPTTELPSATEAQTPSNPEPGPEAKVEPPATTEPPTTNLTAPEVAPAPDPAPPAETPNSTQPTSAPEAQPTITAPQPAPTTTAQRLLETKPRPAPTATAPRPTETPQPQPAQAKTAPPKPVAVPGKADERQIAGTQPAGPPLGTTVQRATPRPTPSATKPVDTNVGPSGAPKYTANDVSQAISELAQATQAYGSLAPTADRKESKKRKAEYFRKIYRLAGETTFATGLSPQQRETVKQAALAATADADKRAQVAGAAAQWLKLSPAKRGQYAGVLLAGTIENTVPVGKFVEARLMPATGGNPVTLITAQPNDLKPQASVVITGAILDEPGKQLAAYEGNAPLVVWTGMVLPAPSR